MHSDPQQKPYKWDETLNTPFKNIRAILLVAVCRTLLRKWGYLADSTKMAIRKKKLCRQWKLLPTLNKEKEPLWYRVKLLHREKERKNQWGSRGLQAWPEVSWWELITVQERARLVWTSLAAKFTECTWSSEASFLTLWDRDPVPWKASDCECCRWCRPHTKGWCGE